MKALTYNKLEQDFEIDETVIHIVKIAALRIYNR
jgi:hypothetical protein